ncbi:MAG: metallophosphoesterase [Saprospiraceae bacterium]
MIRFLIPLIVLVIVDIYTFQLFKTIAKDSAPWIQKAINVTFWAIPAAILIITILAATQTKLPFSKAVITYGRAFFFIAYLSKFVIAAMLLLTDLAIYSTKIFQYFGGDKTALVNYTRSKFIKNAALILGALPFTTLIYGMIRNAYRYTIERVTISLDDLPEALEGLKIVQISDIHSGSFAFKEPIKRGVELINKEAADLVFFTGDLVNDKAKEMDGLMDIFDKIESKLGIFSIFGNHDYGDYAPWKNNDEKVQNLETLKGVHKKLGWDLLLNENRILDINGAQVGIIGVENWSAAKRFRTAGDLKKAYEGVENTQLKLLLSHDPSHWDAQVNKEYKDIDITFSGHTHGMQFGIKIPGFINWSPIKYVYKQWAGLYQKGQQFIYVNRGFGFLGYPGRIGMLPEITVIELKRKV